jgi:predicted dehydrogenase
MGTLTRRSFLDQSTRWGLGAIAGSTIALGKKTCRAVSPNEKITLGIIGVRGRGYALAMNLAVRPDCQIAYLADVDTSLFDAAAPEGYAERVDPSLRGPRAAGIEKAQGKAAKTVQDFRRILDDKSVDAVVIATPDHWHAPATIWACQAGKDVYVEKPASHNPWEGRMMVEAARKYKRVVQLGTQSRSAPYILAAKEYIRQGKLGKIHLCRVHTMHPWGNFPMAPDSDRPTGLDWDMWNGPAPEHRYNPTFRNQWHHFWRYSGGDIINNGVHSVDLGRWLCGVEYPRSVHASGGRFSGQGAAETPDTQVVTWDFDGLIMTFEMTLYAPYMIKADRVIRDGHLFPYWPQNGDRVELYGERGLMYTGPVGSGWQVFERQKNREPVVTAQMLGRFPDTVHQDNFLRCIRSRELPNADIREGHLSTLLCQLANISQRLGGQNLQVDPKTESFTNSPEGNKLLKRQYRKPWVISDQV